MTPDRFFTPADLDAVRAAVREAEERTAGEIVPHVVERSDEYPGAAWKGAALGAFLAPFAAAAVYRWSSIWGVPLLYWILLPPLVGGAVGYFVTAFLPPLRRFMAGEEMLEARTRRRAAEAFVRQEVFRTRDRTGILLFLSLFEHRVVLLADSGIHEKVEVERWEAITGRVAQGIRRGQPGPALVEAIRECGEILERHGVARRADDRDELANELRRERE
jgi:putative membrane protein